MINIGIFTLIVFVVEIILAFVFAAVAQLFYQNLGLNFRSIIKGLTERMFLTIALFNDYPHALTLFSALKLATRLKHKDADAVTENRFNDFYLVGNMVSVSIAIFYVYLLKKVQF